MMKRLASVVLRVILLAGLLLPSVLAAAEIRVRASNHSMPVNESFVLEYEASESPDGEPDFSPLTRDFHLVNQSQSQNIQMINGAINRSIKWVLTMMPRGTGSYVLPKIAFGSDNSNSITLQVTAATDLRDQAGDDPDLFVELKALPEISYPQAQILLRVRLYRTVDIADASLTAPEVDDPDAVIKQLGQNRSFQVQRGTRSYQVVEQRYLLTPQRSGKLTVSPVQFQGRVPDSDPRRRSFGLAPFGGFNQAGKIRRESSKSVAIEVKPIPAGQSVTGWLPAKEVVLTDDWGGGITTFTVGEPITRTLGLMANGLAAIQLPDLAGEFPDGLKSYPDQPVLRDDERAEGVIGIRQEKIAIIPTRAGSFTLPAIEIPWWNVTQQRMELARLPEQVIEVQPSVNDAVATEKRDASAKIISQPTASVVEPVTSQVGAVPLWLVFVLAGGWLVTALGWWYTQRAVVVSSKPLKREEVLPSTGNLKSGCASADPSLVAKSVLQWAEHTWPNSGLRSLGAVAQRLNGTEAANKIHQLERVLYASGKAVQWEGSNLLVLLQDAANEKADRQIRPVIAPLNPQ